MTLPPLPAPLDTPETAEQVRYAICASFFSGGCRCRKGLDRSNHNHSSCALSEKCAASVLDTLRAVLRS